MSTETFSIDGYVFGLEQLDNGRWLTHVFDDGWDTIGESADRSEAYGWAQRYAKGDV